MTAKKKEPGFKPLPSQNTDWDKVFDKVFDEPPGSKSPLEPNIHDVAPNMYWQSLAISAKRQADALERIANTLEEQNKIASLLSDELRG